MNNATYETMENVRKRINVKLVKKEKDYLKFTSKRCFMSHNLFDNNLDVIRKKKLALKLNKSASVFSN